MASESAAVVLRVRAADGGARLCVELETPGATGAVERRTLTVLTARLTRPIEKGPITGEVLEALVHEDAIAGAVGRGLRSLAAAASSRARLAQKLRASGVPAEAAREAVDMLAAQGYLDEEENARREAERGLAKYWGDRRILADLHAKGYGEAGLSAAEARLSAEDGAARCAALLRRRRIALPAPDDRAGLYRLLGALARMGYTSAEAREALHILTQRK